MPLAVAAIIMQLVARAYRLCIDRIGAPLFSTFVIFALLSSLAISRGASVRTYTVEIRDSGFYPAELTIRRGDTITFRNAASRAVWPASDPHPTHTDLSTFDPKRGIEPGSSWSYTFAEPGSWRYHDHLDTVSQGEIFVLGSTGAIPQRRGSYCDGACFDDLIRETVHENGVDAAYQLFVDTYEKGTLPRGCHWTAHRIGEAAYDLYKSGEDFTLSRAMTYCGYGFFHGFLEKLLRDDRDPKTALAFCEKVNAQLGNMGLQNCYHGIGHGYTEDPPDPQAYGDFQAMIKPGIEMCEFLFGKNFTNLNLCLTGVFTVPVGFAADNEYGLGIDPHDPFAECRTQPYRYQKACYGEYAAKLDSVLDWDITRLPAYEDRIADPKVQRLVTWVVPSVMMAKVILSPGASAAYIGQCREAFSGRLREICWGGLILGFFQHGEPNKQYEKVALFCGSSQWQTSEERAFCWKEGVRQMRVNYGAALMQTACASVPAEYRKFCSATLDELGSPYDDPSFDTP